jgi:glycerol-3-phosphate acyltransferase PlsY
MSIGIALLAALIGYLSGSISYAVLVTRLAAPGGKLSKISVTVPDSDLKIESDTISATTVRLQLGARYGCLVSMLDMAKAAVPAFIFKVLYPEMPYYLIAAGMATVGHIWPIFHRFSGGRGLSCIIGGMLVVDWVGVLVTNLIAGAVGVWRKNFLITTGAGITLMIPWLWVRTGDMAVVIYAIAMNILYWTSMIPEIKQYRAIEKSGEIGRFQDATQYNVIGVDGTERVDTITIPAIQKRMAAWMGKKPTEQD